MPKDTHKAGGQDGGRDIVVALNLCIPGVLTAEDLDAEIPRVYQEKNITKLYPRRWCGIESQTWHHSCIYRALCRKYGASRVVWQKLTKNAIYQKGHGILYARGILNHRCYDNVDKSGDWSHSVAIDTNNKLLCELNSSGWQPLATCFKKDKHLQNLLSEVWFVYKLQILPEEHDGFISGLETDDEISF